MLLGGGLGASAIKTSTSNTTRMEEVPPLALDVGVLEADLLQLPADFGSATSPSPSPSSSKPSNALRKLHLEELFAQWISLPETQQRVSESSPYFLIHTSSQCVQSAAILNLVNEFGVLDALGFCGVITSYIKLEELEFYCFCVVDVVFARIV